MDPKKTKRHKQTYYDSSDDTASEITLSELQEQYATQASYDTLSTTSDYIVIETGNDKSDPRVTCENYNVNGQSRVESRTSDPETITNSNGTVDHGFEDDLSYSSVKAAVSVEEEMHQRYLEYERTKKVDVETDTPTIDSEDVVSDFQENIESRKPDFHENIESPKLGYVEQIPEQPAPPVEEEVSPGEVLASAVKNDAPHLINDLIDRSSSLRVHTGFLSSITLGRDHISKMFLEHPKYGTVAGVAEDLKLGRLSDSMTTEDDANVLKNNALLSTQMTPIMLSSLRNQYEIVELLMNMGERIDEPHSLTCSCDDCDQLQTDQLRAAKLRLNTYRSLSCNAYVVLANADPIYTAFELRQKLLSLSNREKHYKSEYLHLAEQISCLPGMVLDKVVDGQELDIILNEKSGCGVTTYDNLSRLKLAVRKGEKKFVAHPACQKKLASMWIGSLNPKWVDGVGNSVMFFILLTIAYPFMVIPYWLWPKNRMGDFLRTPIVKFTASTSAYFMFMGILMVSSFSETASTNRRISEHPEMGKHYANYINNTPHVLVEDHYIRFHNILLLNMLLCVWLLGMIWENVKKILHEGSTFFTDNMFNLLNFTSLGFYVFSFGFRFHAFAEVTKSIKYFSTEDSWQALAFNDSSAIANAYWLSADRRTWTATDPTFIAEAVYSLATIFSITKITYVFTISERLGPLLISLVKMMEDVFAFMVLFVFIIAAFVVGFHNLYWYYYNSDHIVTEPHVSFKSVTNIIELFFWSIFGLVELEEDKFSTHNTSQLTSIMAYVLFAIYNWMMVIILINMLIAMMSRSYEIIAEMEDIEWKYARTKLFLEYMRDDSTIAYPYNLVPTWKGVYLLCKSFADDWCYRLAGRPPRKLRSTKLPSKKPKPPTQKDLELLQTADMTGELEAPNKLSDKTQQAETDVDADESTSLSGRAEETTLRESEAPSDCPPTSTEEVDNGQDSEVLINTDRASQDSAIGHDTPQPRTDTPPDGSSGDTGEDGHQQHDSTRAAREDHQPEQGKTPQGKTPQSKVANLEDSPDITTRTTENNGDKISTTKTEDTDVAAEEPDTTNSQKKRKKKNDDKNAKKKSKNSKIKTPKEEKSNATATKSDKVVPSDIYKKVIREVVKRFTQKGGGADDDSDGIEQLQVDMSGLRKELMTNIFRQDQERAVMAGNIINIQKDLIESQEAFTHQHAHLKLENEKRISEMKSNMKDLQLEICQTLESMNQFLIDLRQEVTSQIQDTKERVFQQIKVVHNGINELDGGLQKQAKTVTNIHGTLEKQVIRVNTIYGTLSNLRSDVNTVQGTLAKSVFLQDDMEIIDVDGGPVIPVVSSSDNDGPPPQTEQPDTQTSPPQTDQPDTQTSPPQTDQPDTQTSPQ